jgi:hypothetical protein
VHHRFSSNKVDWEEEILGCVLHFILSRYHARKLRNDKSVHSISGYSDFSSLISSILSGFGLILRLSNSFILPLLSLSMQQCGLFTADTSKGYANKIAGKSYYIHTYRCPQKRKRVLSSFIYRRILINEVNRLQNGLLNSRKPPRASSSNCQNIVFSNANKHFFSNSDRDFYFENNSVSQV